MHKTRVYVDTSVFGGTRDEEFALASRRFFALAAAGQVTVIVSAITVDELSNAPADVQEILKNLPDGVVEQLGISAEARQLAQAYINAGVLKEASIEDASHVAIATIAGADLILSWNFRHLVNYGRIRRFNSVNIALGYRQIEIRSPLEIGYDDEDI